MDTTLSDPLVDRLLDGRYAIEARLARGGMGSVYLATDVRLERRVAVKVMHAALAEDPEFVARFNREARAAARLSHPDAVAVYDQGSDDGHVFLVMEYVPGETLREVLRQRGKLSPGEAVAVMDHVLAALGAAHAAGLVHRDVKPENVLVTADGRVKVADFGLARAVAGTTLTTDQSVTFGTAAYVAPEQVSAGVADARSDVYSAGILFFELLTGTTPYSGETPLSVAYQHMRDDVPAPSSRVPGVPGDLDQVVLAATARDPQARPVDARALHAQLVAARDRLGLHAAVPTPAVDMTMAIPRDGATTVIPAVDARRTAALPPVPPTLSSSSSASAKPRRPRRRWPFVVAFVALLAGLGGLGGWYLAVGRYTRAPSVLRLTWSQAAARIDHAGLHAQRGAPRYDAGIPIGRVVAQDPGAGAHVQKGAKVTVHLSLGPHTVGVPDVVGNTVKAATAKLHHDQLSVRKEKDVYSTSVKAGHVISTDPPAGQTVDVNTGVRLVVSRGPKPVAVPDVSTKTYDQAVTILQPLGLKPVPVDRYSDTVPTGTVIGTNPPASTTAHQGDTIKVLVSRGPHLYAVPDVTGENVQDAVAKLQHDGFHTKVHAFPGGPGDVLRQSPGGGSMQKKGTTVTLFVF